MSETVEEVTRWANVTFGPATILRQFSRAMEEMRELHELMMLSPEAGKMKVAEEAADVVICLYRIIGMTNPSAIDEKMAINRARTWKVDGEGCAYHEKETP